MAHRLSCSATGGIFPDQGLNPCLLHWQVGSLPLSHREAQRPISFNKLTCDSAGKESACNAGDLGSIPGLERSAGEGNGYPLQYSCLESLAGSSPWGQKESDVTEHIHSGQKASFYPKHLGKK